MFAICTTPASEQFEWLHHRLPYILPAPDDVPENRTPGMDVSYAAFRPRTRTWKDSSRKRARPASNLICVRKIPVTLPLLAFRNLLRQHELEKKKARYHPARKVTSTEILRPFEDTPAESCILENESPSQGGT